MTTRTRRAWTTVLAAALATALLAGCGALGAEREGVGKYEVRTIRYQSSSGAVIGLLELADALGHLDPLALERVGQSQGGPESLRGVATGDTDVGGAFNGAIAKLASTGAPVTAVVSYYGSHGPVDSSLFTLENGDIRKAEDLVGKKVAVNTLGANAEAVLDTYLRESGLSEAQIDRVTLVPLPTLNMEAALRQGQVQAAYLFSATKEVAVERGGLRELVNDIELVGPYNGGSYVLRDDFIQKYPNTSAKVVDALARALRYTQTHSTEKVREVLRGYLDKQGRAEGETGLDLWKGTGVATRGGVIQDGDFELWLDWLVAEGEVDAGEIQVGDIYTNEFNPYADKTEQKESR